MKYRNILIICSLLLVIFFVVKYAVQNKNSELNKKGNFVNSEPVMFTWKYEKADSLNLDGIPNTNIFLEIKYENGIVQNKLVGTTPGSCNDLPDLDIDSITNSTNIQCYSAGLGYRFKIIKGEESYMVLRKTFEESLPDYEPPVYKYEVVLEF